MSEFSRIYDAARLPDGPQQIVASPAECAALAQRFGLVAVKSLQAAATLTADGRTVHAKGRVTANVVQSCAVSADDLSVRIDEPLNLRFVPAATDLAGDTEIELEADQLDEIEMDGTRFDLGEAIAQTMALGIDPYLEGPSADEARRKAGIVSEGQSGPFAALKGLLKD